MQERMSLFDRLKDRKRVDLTPKNYIKKVKTSFAVILLLAGISIGITFLITGLTYPFIGITIGIVLMSFFLIRYLSGKVKETAVKGDTIILKSVDERAIVTSIRSVGHIRSSRFLGIEITSFRFNLDGRIRSALIINRCSFLPSSASDFLKKAIELSKEKKANHKLGSVSAS